MEQILCMGAVGSVVCVLGGWIEYVGFDWMGTEAEYFGVVQVYMEWVTTQNVNRVGLE